MKITVMNKQSAERYAMEQQCVRTIVISIASCGCSEAFIIPNKFNKIVDVKFVHFNDTDSKAFTDGGINSLTAREIKEFVDKHIEADDFNEIIVHCEAGRSRSAGVAAALMVYLNNDDSAIFNSGMYNPNMLVYRTMLNVLMEDN